MRFVLAALVWLVMLGGLGLFVAQRDRYAFAPQEAPARQLAPGEELSLEITTTFSPQADPFALEGDEGGGAPLVVRNAARELFRGEGMEPGIPFRVHPIPGLSEGLNEIFLRAKPPLAESEKNHAVRVRILRDGEVVADQTLWGTGGAGIAGNIIFNLKGPEQNP